jgi:dipeptidyl aminopeptidase/acylaminoacyl peptidase
MPSVADATLPCSSYESGKRARLKRRLRAAALILWPAALFGQPTVTVEDLTRRVQIPLAAISPSGKLASYVLVRGDPQADDYELSICAIETHGHSSPRTLRSYRLTPEETFNELDWLQPGASQMRWIGKADMLLFTARRGGTSELNIWDAQEDRVQTVLAGHDRIEFESEGSSIDTLALTVTDYLPSPRPESGVPPDRSWLVRDGDRFFGPLKNPKLGRHVRKQRWILSQSAHHGLRADGNPIEQWDSLPVEVNHTTSIPASEPLLFDETPSPDGKLIAAIEIREPDLDDSRRQYSTFRVVVSAGKALRVLVPDTRPFVLARTSLLGWARDGRSIYYLHVSPRGTTIHKVTLGGKITTLWHGSELLAEPFPPNRHYQLMSRDERYVVLIRSTNVMPGELVKIDLHRGRLISVVSPNETFKQRDYPQVHFYEIPGVEGDAWGRLYLPRACSRLSRCPLLFTQYGSSPGFAEDIGDQIPIFPLTAHGVAVFDMYSNALVPVTPLRDARLALNRVRRPLLGMQWMARQLSDEGLIDPDRIGIAGVSYGAEIAMYAYWNWTALRAVSAATATWDPTLDLFSGPSYQHTMRELGFPSALEADGLAAWRRYAASLNARADLPPLLFQSPDGEQNFTVPSWTALRSAEAPVEWLEYPNEGHVKIHPANKWWVYQRNLDWFRFWLKEEEDPHASKAEQYARWRRMRVGK